MSGASTSKKIWGAGVNSPRSYAAEFVFFCFLSIFLFVRHTTMLGTESLDGVYTHYALRIELGGNGHKAPWQF